MQYFTLTEVAQGLGVFLGAAGVTIYGLKKNGKIHFGTPKERRSCAKTCSQHSAFVAEVRRNTIATEELNRKVDRMAKDLNTAVGFIKAKTGGRL